MQEIGTTEDLLVVEEGIWSVESGIRATGHQIQNHCV